MHQTVVPKVGGFILVSDHILKDIVVEKTFYSPLSTKGFLQFTLKPKVVKLKVFQPALELDCHEVLLLLLLLLLSLLALKDHHLLLSLLVKSVKLASLILLACVIILEDTRFARRS